MRRHQPLLAAALLFVAIAVAGCAGGAASPSVGPTAVPNSPTSPAGPGGSGVVSTPEQAAAIVLGSDARFAGFERFNPDMIGGCCWWQAEPAPDGGYQVTVHYGWGDCPSGCINEHEWTYNVSPDGEVTLVDETGDPVGSGPLPEDGASG